MSAHDHNPNRRKVLECMTWAGTGVLWTVAGGVPLTTGLDKPFNGEFIVQFNYLR